MDKPFFKNKIIFLQNLKAIFTSTIVSLGNVKCEKRRILRTLILILSLSSVFSYYQSRI